MSEVHRVLCEEFLHKLHNMQKNINVKGYKIKDKIIELIDTAKYYNIFTVVPDDYNYHPIDVIWYNMTVNAHIYVILTRRVIPNNIVLNSISKLKTQGNINKFFSLYSPAEIILILHYNQDDCFTYCHQVNLYFSGTLIFITIINYNNEILTRYILDYAICNNISLCTIVNHEQQFPHYYISRDDDQYDIIIEHEKTIIFMNSLRYSWLMACIL